MVKIYILIDPRDFLIKYVGQTTSEIEERLYDHIQEAKRGVDKGNKRCNWIRSLTEKNLSPISILIDSCSTVEADKKEQYYITHFLNLGFDLKNTQYKGNYSESYRSKNRFKKIVYQYKENGELIGEYESIRMAAKKSKCDKTTIGKCCIGVYQRAGGYFWSYSKVDKIPPINSVKKEIHRYSKEGIYLDSYDSVVEAAKKFKIWSNSISSIATGNHSSKLTGGFLWSHIKTDKIPPYVNKLKREVTYEGKTYESLAAASRDTGIPPMTISNRVKN